ncbi:unnamed protein product [Caenorhabditis sp. 36 PRJEB53466]|nr:unnamed protein product [Caenorhabditis sp. 36 PRJEB53466]
MRRKHMGRIKYENWTLGHYTSNRKLHPEVKEIIRKAQKDTPEPTNIEWELLRYHCNVRIGELKGDDFIPTDKLDLRSVKNIFKHIGRE